MWRDLRKITKKWKLEERRGWWAEVAVLERNRPKAGRTLGSVPHRAIMWTRCSPLLRLEELSSPKEAKSELSCKRCFEVSRVFFIRREDEQSTRNALERCSATGKKLGQISTAWPCWSWVLWTPSGLTGSEREAGDFCCRSEICCGLS